MKTYPQKKIEKAEARIQLLEADLNPKNAQRNGKVDEEELFLTPEETYQAPRKRFVYIHLKI